MVDIRHRDVWRVWYHLESETTSFAIFIYAVDRDDAIERGQRHIEKHASKKAIIEGAELR